MVQSPAGSNGSRDLVTADLCTRTPQSGLCNDSQQLTAPFNDANGLLLRRITYKQTERRKNHSQAAGHRREQCADGAAGAGAVSCCRALFYTHRFDQHKDNGKRPRCEHSRTQVQCTHHAQAG